MPIEISSTYVKGLYLSGLAAQLTFGKNIQNKVGDEKLLFHQHIIETKNNNNNLIDKNNFKPDEALSDLFRLLCFIQAWSDFDETWTDVGEEYKKKRQQMKFKKNIDKPTRRSIHLGLFKSVYENLCQFEQATEDAKEKDYVKNLLNQLEQTYFEPNKDKNFKKAFLIYLINKFLKYKNFCFDDGVIKENFLEAAKLISTFSLWHDKFFYGCGIGMGLIAALACGLSTGGAIFVLLMGFSLPLGFVIPLSLLIFLAGTKANFQLFSQHIPQFFQDLFKSGGITEFINPEGKRVQLSRSKKFLLLPAGFLSLSVGIAAAAITYLEGTKMIALICPILAATCPHLMAALLGILASALLVGLTIVMLRTFIGVLQSQFSWEKIKQAIQEKWQNLNCTKVLGYVFKVLVMAAAFFGLVYLDFTGTATLAGLLGWVAADIITLVAIMGDLPFTLITALAWCNSLFKRNSNLDPDVTKNIKYYLWKIVEFFSLIINALGNAALVFTDSCASRVASIACFMNSYANNRIQEDDSKLIQARKAATNESINSLYKFFRSPLNTQIPKASNSEELSSSTNLKTSP